MANQNNRQNVTKTTSVFYDEPSEPVQDVSGRMKFRKPSPTIEAMQLSYSGGPGVGNADEIARWCHGRVIFDAIKDTVVVEKMATDGMQVDFILRQGDWLLRRGNDEWSKFTNEEFKNEGWSEV